MNQKQIFRISKFLSLVLRHKPETIGLELDDNGWTDVEVLLEKMNNSGKTVNLALLQEVVKNNNKKRFAFDENGKRIRANQGHSVQINLGYQPQEPPSILFHGTATRFLDSIFEVGLEKRSRHHVHLSANLDTATSVGKRHGKVIILEVMAKEMFEKGMEFFVSENGVWLTDNVPVEYLKKMEN